MDARVERRRREGSAFLYNMMRIPVGTLSDVARGSPPEGTIAKVLWGEGPHARGSDGAGAGPQIPRAHRPRSSAGDGSAMAAVSKSRSAVVRATANGTRAIDRAGLWREPGTSTGWGGYAGTRDQRIHDQLAVRPRGRRACAAASLCSGVTCIPVASTEMGVAGQVEGVVRAPRRPMTRPRPHVRGGSLIVSRQWRLAASTSAVDALAQVAPHEPRHARGHGGGGAGAEPGTRVAHAKVGYAPCRGRRVSTEGGTARLHELRPVVGAPATADDGHAHRAPRSLVSAIRCRGQATCAFDRPRAADATFVALAAHLSRG